MPQQQCVGRYVVEGYEDNMVIRGDKWVTWDVECGVYGADIKLCCIGQVYVGE